MVVTAKALPANSPAASPPPQLASALGGAELSDGDRRTLRRSLIVIRGARADLNSSDPKAAAAAKSRLGLALHYVVGFLDGTGLGGAAPDPGFVGMFAPDLAQGDLSVVLDNIDKALGEMVDPSRTGMLIPIGIIVAATGVALKTIGEALKD